MAADFETADAVMREFLGEPTALAYTPDHLMPTEPMPQAWIDAIDGSHWVSDRETTVQLAVESARRWARRTDLSPELRLRRIWTVLTTALNEETR